MQWPLTAEELARWTALAERTKLDYSTNNEEVIGIGTALTDHEQVNEHDLMFLEGDEVIVLQKLDSTLYLGYCEGVIGTFDSQLVNFNDLSTTIAEAHRFGKRRSNGLGIVTRDSFGCEIVLEEQQHQRRSSYHQSASSSPVSPVSPVSNVDLSLSSLSIVDVVASPSNVSHTTPSLTTSPSTDFDESSVGHEMNVANLSPFQQARFDDFHIREDDKIQDCVESLNLLRPTKFSSTTVDSDDGTIHSPSSPNDDRTLSMIFDSYRYSTVSTNAPVLNRLDSTNQHPILAKSEETVEKRPNLTGHDEAEQSKLQTIAFGAASNLRNQLEAKTTTASASNPTETEVANTMGPIPVSKERSPLESQRESTDTLTAGVIPRLSAIFPRSGTMDSLGSIKIPITPSPTTTTFPMHRETNSELEAARRLFSAHFDGPVSASSLHTSDINVLQQRQQSLSTTVAAGLPNAPIATKHRSLSLRRKSVKGLTISAPIIPMTEASSKPEIVADSSAEPGRTNNISKTSRTKVAFDLPDRGTGKNVKPSAIPISSVEVSTVGSSDRLNPKRDVVAHDIQKSAVPLTPPSSIAQQRTAIPADPTSQPGPTSSTLHEQSSVDHTTLHSTTRRPIRPISVVPTLDHDQINNYRSQESAWIKALSSSQLNGSTIRQSKKLKSLVMQGIPSSVRAQVWAQMVDVDEFVVPGLYQSLCEQESNGLDERIFHDVREVGQDYPRLAGEDSVKQELASVIKALVRHDRELRYSRALVLFAAVFLSQFAIGESTFWMCIAVLNQTGHRKYFTRLQSDQDLVRISTLTFGLLLELTSPLIAQTFVKLRVDPSAFFSHWTSSMFVTVLPWSSCIRIVDLLLLDSKTFELVTSLSIVKTLQFEDERLFSDRKSLLYAVRHVTQHQGLRVEELLPQVLTMSGFDVGTMTTKLKKSTIDKVFKQAKLTIQEMNNHQEST
ncbi:hypothetical protein OIO90_001796 [Microbotryomycetes sp. JL221]|nr:hypothetical protein OIO90_001796 [Microbotryomycetes sp. JL221]